jgi:hypothetical protein
LAGDIIRKKALDYVVEHADILGEDGAGESKDESPQEGKD